MRIRPPVRLHVGLVTQGLRAVWPKLVGEVDVAAAPLALDTSRQRPGAKLIRDHALIDGLLAPSAHISDAVVLLMHRAIADLDPMIVAQNSAQSMAPDIP